MIIPIVCENTQCAGAGTTVNQIAGILPPDLNLFYEAYDDADPLDHCPVCGGPGTADDPILEYEWEKKYYD